MKFAIVTLEDGNQIKTSINGTNEEIQNYYLIGSYLNMGIEDDNMQRIVSVEITN